MTQLQSVTCHTGSHSVTCHPTQVNTLRLHPSQTGWYSINLTRRNGKPSWPIDDWLYIEMVYGYSTQTVTHSSTHPAVHGCEGYSRSNIIK